MKHGEHLTLFTDGTVAMGETTPEPAPALTQAHGNRQQTPEASRDHGQQGD